MSDQLLNRNVAVNEDSITAIANAIKGKMYNNAKIKPINFATAIKNIGVSSSGTANISTTNLTNISQYNYAKITDNNLITDNIKAETTILGVNGKNSVVITDNATILSPDMAYNKTAYANGIKVTGNNHIYVSGQTLYMPEGWINVGYSGNIFGGVYNFLGTELYSGQSVGLL